MNHRPHAGDFFALGATLSRPFRRHWIDWRKQLLIRRSRLPLYVASVSDQVGQQIVFANLLRQQQETLKWIPNPIYHVGGSADPAFLSILVRVLTENRIRCVMEFGAGETTRILSAWSAETGGEVFTIEHDQGWVEALGQLTSGKTHHLFHAPLRDTPFGMWYDLSSFKERFPAARADLLIVDGPIGTRRRSRAGIVGEFQDLIQTEWIVMWDDLHRFGDLESFASFVKSLRQSSTAFDLSFCQAFRTLGLVYTGRNHALKHYC